MEWTPSFKRHRGAQIGVVCWRQRQIDPGCRFQLTQLKTSGTVVAYGFAGYGRGSPKIGNLSKKFVGANSRPQAGLPGDRNIT